MCLPEALCALNRRLDTNMLYVTHDQVEAMTLADRIVVFNAGRVEQVGTPREVYEGPRNIFVAQFIGSPKMNLLACSIELKSDELRCSFADGAFITLSARRDSQVRPGRAWLGVRPEHLTLSSGEGLALTGTVTHVEYLGDEVLAHVELKLGATVTLKRPGGTEIRASEPVRVGVIGLHCHLFDADGARID